MIEILGVLGPIAGEADTTTTPAVSTANSLKPWNRRPSARGTFIETIPVHSRSRFFRDLFQFLQYERVLKKAGVKIRSITQQTGDDAAGEMASKLFSLFDEYQSKENAKHTQRAMQENARQGYWNGSVPPFGERAVTTDIVGNRGRHRRRLELDPLEAETVREIYRLYLAGHEGQVRGMKAIATFLNRQGLTMRGRPWRIQSESPRDSHPLPCHHRYFHRLLLSQHRRPKAAILAQEGSVLLRRLCNKGGQNYPP